MKILFLDIDGVLNSTRSAIALGNFPHTTKTLRYFDVIALRLIRKVCKETGCKICLSSTWRNDKNWEEIGPNLKLPIIDRTPRSLSGYRGKEIEAWLNEHPEVNQYAIVDDDGDMLEKQHPYFVHTSHSNGFLFEDYEKLLELLK